MALQAQPRSRAAAGPNMARSDGSPGGDTHRVSRTLASPRLPGSARPGSACPPARPPSLFAEARLGLRRLARTLRRCRHLPGSSRPFRRPRACAAGAAMAERGGAAAARSRSLFLWDDGSPMRFYVRPGLAKLRLAPLVLAGGGRLCRVQEPGAVLLAQPGEAAPGGAVSTEYVTECVERNQRLPLEPFRLPAAPPVASPPAASPRGRLAFTEAEDAALLRAVRGRCEARARGRALWKELERAGLTRHSWQAMRDRYLRRLRPLLGGELGAAWRRGGRPGRGEADGRGGGRGPGPRCTPAVDARLFPQSPSGRRSPRRARVFSRQLIGSSKPRR